MTDQEVKNHLRIGLIEKGAKEFREYKTFEAAYNAACVTSDDFKAYEKEEIKRKLRRIDAPSTRWIVIEEKLYYIYTACDGVRLLKSFSPISVMSSKPFATVTMLSDVGVLSLSPHQYKRDRAARAIYAKEGMVMTIESI